MRGTNPRVESAVRLLAWLEALPPELVWTLKEMVRVLRPGVPLILAVTRSGLLGSWIELHWGNECFDAKTLISLMAEAGLTSIHVYPFTAGLARWTSLAYVGFKPHY